MTQSLEATLARLAGLANGESAEASAARLLADVQAFIAAGAGGVKAKSADQQVTNSTALVDVDDLYLDVAAASITRVRLMLLAHSVGGFPSGAIKLAWSVPAGASLYWLRDALAGSDVTALREASVDTPSPPDNVDGILTYSGVLIAPAAGRLQLRFAQNSAALTASSILKGSWIAS